MPVWRPVEDEVIETPKGRLVLGNPAPGIFRTVAEGSLSMEAARAFTRFGEAVLEQAEGGIGMHDWYKMTGYDSGVRQYVVKWSVSVIKRWAEIHVGLKSKVVRMGVTLANVALGGKVTIHDDRQEFASFTRRTIEKRRSA